MNNEFCNVDCIDVLPQFDAIDICNLSDSFRSGEITKIILGVCNLTFTDILDPAEWTAHKTAGLISIPFMGNGNIGETTYKNTVRVGTTDVSSGARKPFEFMTKLVDNVAQTEWALFNDLHDTRTNLGVMFLNGDGHLILDPDWTTGTNPLVAQGLININQVFGGEADGQMEYRIKGEMTEDRSLKIVKLPQSVLDILK